ncbi:MAG: spore coat protein U domain-containing protein [Candidatus Eremiobacteraeota bacterium]|nr:spore coat protein U domain-containing protein [Candidatus Eremiobacteraeota bacterium]
MTVTATVVASCTLTSGNLNFGNYNPIGANAGAALLGTAEVTATCSQGACAQVDIDPGLNPSGSGNAQQRRMKGPGSSSYLGYDIYKDSGRTQRWGSKTSGSTVSVTGGGSAAPVRLTAYGSVPAAQQVQVGAYTDSVAVTINY